MRMGHPIGIDIGTANTRVAVFRNGQAEVIPDKNGQRSMPSYVAFTERCRLFGSAAKAQAASNPTSTVYGVKRILGQLVDELDVDRYHTGISPNDVSLKPPEMTISVKYKKRAHRVSPLQVIGMLLSQARTNAEAYLGETVQDAVISVPVYFNRLQRLAVRDAAQLAGLNVTHIGSGIESIALYYACTTSRWDVERVSNCVFLDFGAGFFNAGLVRVECGVIQPQSCASDKYLGGEDLIDRVYNSFAAEVQGKWGWNINTDIRARRRLRVACEAAMRELSSTASTTVYIDSLYGGQDFAGHLSRKSLEELCQDLFRSTLQSLDRIHADSKIDKSSVDEIVIVGGCSRIPKLQKVWSDYFYSKPLVKVVNPDEGEVLGNAIYAAFLAGQTGSLLNDFLLLQIEPFHVGLGIKEGLMSVIVYRNTSTMTRISREYRLCDLSLTPHERPILRFYQGNSRRVNDNLLIGTLDLSGILHEWNEGNAEDRIEVQISIDERTIVEASAVVERKSTNPTAWHPVMPRDRKDIERLISRAAAYEEDDALEEALVAERCALDSRLASLGEIQPPTFQTKRMVGLLESLVLWRNRLDELEPGSLTDYREYGKALDEVERGLKMEELRVVEITGLRSHAEELRTKLTATTQTPKTEALLQSVDSVTQWVDQNEEAEIQEYRAKLHSLMAVSMELITLSEAPPSREPTPSTGTPQRPENGTRAQTNRLRGLDELFPESGWDTRSKYTDAEFGDIASYLRNTGHESWSKVPRIYTVLRLVDQVELIDAFLQRGMTDIWFPFSDNTLPKALKQPHRAQFLQIQEVVFSKALQLERGARLDDQRSHRKHAHFSRSEPLPFKVVGNLGSGAHGVVDKVVSTLSYKEYARKRFKRPLGSTAKQNEAKSFLNEVKILKKLHNRHCIDLVCMRIFSSSCWYLEADH